MDEDAVFGGSDRLSAQSYPMESADGTLRTVYPVEDSVYSFRYDFTTSYTVELWQLQDGEEGQYLSHCGAAYMTRDAQARAVMTWENFYGYLNKAGVLYVGTVADTAAEPQRYDGATVIHLHGGQALTADGGVLDLRGLNTPTEAASRTAEPVDIGLYLCDEPVALMVGTINGTQFRTYGTFSVYGDREIAAQLFVDDGGLFYSQVSDVVPDGFIADKDPTGDYLLRLVYDK